MIDVDIGPLVAPNSIALLGASCTNNSFGRAMLDMALFGNFKGRIYPVNPKYTDGLGCYFYNKLSDLPETVEHGVLAVANESLKSALLEAIEHAAKARIVFADCYGKTHEGIPLKDRLKEIAEASKILLCGPKSMGFHNLDQGLKATKLLTGYRGQKDLAFDALYKAASNISRLAFDLADHIDEMNVNPILISATQAVALDVTTNIKS